MIPTMPTIIIWYVVRRFLATFAFTIVAMCLLFVIIDLFEHLESFLDHNVSFMGVVWYYVVFLPYMAKLLIPVSSLLAALFSVGRLAASNEITAMKAAGLGFWRFLAPYLFLALCISLGQTWFNGWVVPKANTAKLEIERTELRSAGGPDLNNLRFRDQPTRNVSIRTYNEQTKVAQAVVIEEFGSTQHPRLVWRLEAPRMTWVDDKGWIADSAMKRVYDSTKQTVSWVYNIVMPFTIPHEQIRKLQVTIDELTFDEIPDYLATQRAGGKDTRRQEIDYYAGWAFPYSNIIVVLIAVPFAAVRRKGGMAVNIAAAMITAFAYIVLSEVIKAVGTATSFDVVVVGWSSTIAFACIALLVVFVFRR